MKKFKVMLSVFMVFVIISVSTTPMLAVISPEDSFVSTNNWQDKIDDLVWNKMNQSTEDEKIPVWIWFTDIDKSSVEDMVEKQTGLNKNNLSVNTDVSTENLVSALELASADNSKSVRANVSKEIELYLEATKEARNIEKERTDIYLRTKRMISKELYETNNNKIINELELPTKDIVFKSVLTPSTIIYITRDEIINIAKSTAVEDIDFYDDMVYDEPDLVDNQKDTMQMDAVYEQFGLSGSGVNVLQYEAAYVNVNADHYSDIKNTDNITVIRNTIPHNSDDSSYFSSLIMDHPPTGPDHANIVASVMQDFAEDVFIYSVADKKFSDIEWALINKDIDVINASTSLGAPTNYYNDAHAKWFDGLVSGYDVTLIASAGNNYYYDDNNNIIRNIVLSPACGYNSIAVGAYTTDGVSSNDCMQQFIYGHINSAELPNYKPDVVVPSGTTSRAAPQLSALVSMMIELEPSLSTQPEIIKAILMASCHRKVKPFVTNTQELITDGLTQKQGAGAVDAYRAVKIVLEGTYGSKTATTYGLNNTATFALSDIDDINVSIAWSRENVNNGISNTTLGTLQELELNVYNGNTLLGSSARTNAGKQMVYLQNLSPNTSYTIKVKKTTNNTEPVTYGYAWSGKNYEQAEMELVGKTAVGRTLTAELYYIDGKAVADEDVTYVWKSSSDGENWQLILNENTNTYTVTSDDWYKYIKCEAILNDTTLSGDTSVNAVTGIRIILYGDVDMNGEVSTMDTTEIQLYLADMKDLTLEQLYAADVDGNNDISIVDITYIQQYIAKIITTFPVEE